MWLYVCISFQKTYEFLFLVIEIIYVQKMNNFKKLNNYNLSCFRINIFKAMILHICSCLLKQIIQMLSNEICDAMIVFTDYYVRHKNYTSYVDCFVGRGRNRRRSSDEGGDLRGG